MLISRKIVKMRSIINICLGIVAIASAASCVSKKEYLNLQSQYDLARKAMEERGATIHTLTNQLNSCERQLALLEQDLENKEETTASTDELKQQQISELREQIADLRKQRDQQIEQVENLTVLTKEASNNVERTLQQLEGKDKYIEFLHKARTRTDSINLALSANLKQVLAEGIADRDVNVEIDKTVVYINLSDKMLFQSGKTAITSRAHEVLGKIARIIESRPNFDVMVEGYTDNVPINTTCLKDNWDLSVIRATTVVRVLQNNYNIDPNRLVAAGRGEYNRLASNDTAAGKAMNRRTRIIILPKLDQFYDLLNPDLAVQ